ncbi:MAG TPA: hypothetical protein VHR47_00270 [Bacillota bacterium]|nr:hypothetical protein [Bacillota bacterium]
MNKLSRKAAVAALVIALAYTLTGYAFYQKQSQLTVSNKSQPTGHYSFPSPRSCWEKASDKMSGNPFIEFTQTSSPLITLPQPSVVSELILLGTLSGPNPQAIVADKNNPQVTRILRSGESWLGEKIISIRKGLIVIWKENQKVILQTAS